MNYNELYGFSDISSSNYKYGYFSAVHDLITTDSGYVLLAEMYYPRYTLDANNVPVYIGNLYTHATVCGFDAAGQKSWDETVELKLNEITMQKAGVMRQLQRTNSKITFAYAEGDFYARQDIHLLEKKVSVP